MKHRGWIVFSGFVWFFIGVMLLYKGVHLVALAAFQKDSLCASMQETFGSAQNAAAFLIAAGSMIGFLKGRFVLAKTAKRVVSRIASQSLPIRFKNAYSPSYWILIGFMMALGMVFRFLPIPIDIRGLIDIAIGSALISGSIFYFKAAKAMPIAIQE
jgi:hypothetical protein